MRLKRCSLRRLGKAEGIASAILLLAILTAGVAAADEDAAGRARDFAVAFTDAAVARVVRGDKRAVGELSVLLDTRDPWRTLEPFRS